MSANYRVAEHPGFGALAHVVKDNVYMIGQPGFIYTAPWIVSRGTRPPSAAIILSAGANPFTLWIKGRELRTRAAIIPPFVARSLFARDVALVSFHIMPSSPHYDAFRDLLGSNVLLPKRRHFDRLNRELELLHQGRLPPAQALDVYETVVRLPIRHLPARLHADLRARHINQLLRAKPELSLTELAKELGASYFWTSRIMAEVFGMSLRDYKSWRKQKRVFKFLHSQQTLTEIAYRAGFTDSAHLSRTYRRWFGQPPSYSRNRDYVRVFCC